MKFNRKIAIGLASATALVSAAAFAFPAYHEEIVYYSDSSMTQSVGEKTVTCYGTIVVSGQVTQHYRYLVKQHCDWWADL